jgi:hypothetical protein
MSQISKIIASILLFASFFAATINLSAANDNNSKTDKTTSNQILNVSETKKILKKKLSLDYTNSRFETDLSQDQKDAILTSLKKWKGELPVDNTFTVTSIASLKTETGDTESKVKKSKKETPNAQVIYMWAKSVNPNWPAGRIPTGEESEEGDPRFIRTEFNVLLKANKNGKYKASIERDTEVKTEALEVTENPLDTQIYKDLFGTDKADNALTATQDILVDAAESSSISSSSISSINSSSTVSSAVSNSSIAISSSNPISSTSNQISSVISIKKVGFLESLLNFGSVKASAGEFDYSFPWKNGDTWGVSQSWHGCGIDYANNYQYPTTENTYGCALDLYPKYVGMSDEVLIPKSGVAKRICNDPYQSKFKIDNMAIYHIASNSALNTNSNGVYLVKSSYLGKEFYPPASPRDAYGNFVTDCGTTNGPHIHMKLNGINPNSGSFQFSNATLYGNVNYGQMTSDNTPPLTNTTQNVLLRDVNGGNNSVWKFSNTVHTGDTAFPNYIPPEWKVAGMGDFNADGYQDIFWRNSNTGENVLWEMQNGVISQNWGSLGTVGLDFSVAGIGDFNGDGYADVLWRNTGGVNVIWNYQRNNKIGDSGAFTTVPTSWKVISVEDFNNDGKADIFWRNDNGSNIIWNMNNASIISNGSDGLNFVGPEFVVTGVADFNGDYKKDILWRNNAGQNVIWNMNNRSILASTAINSVGINDFIVAGLADFNQDGKADIFWRSITGGQNVIWNMNNTSIIASTAVGTTGYANTQVKGIFAK